MWVDKYRQRIGFAIGTGIVPAVCGLFVVGVTSGNWVAAIIVAIVLWVIVSTAFYYRARRR
jgi:tetrahydromethanopterin S-methyltransferase subunit C